MASKQPDRTATQAAIAFAREDLASFSTLAWPKFELAHHHRAIIERLEAVERGDISRLMIFLPPRHGKSLLGSQLFPAYYLGRHPDRSIIAASYASELAIDFGRKVRNLVAAPVYQAIFPQAKMASDSASAHRFSLLNGGGYFALGAGGAITGRGANLLLIDDPTKSAADANSDAYRRSLHEWFESTAYTRLQGDSAAIVIIATRWHMDDLPGWLLREHPEENWSVLSLPAIAETDEGWRQEGDALWPKRFPLRTLNRTRATVGGAAWASLYQGQPAAAEGAIFKRDWWRFWTEATLPARFEQTVLSIDSAYKTGRENDYSVGLILAVGTNGFYVLDVSRKRLEFPALKREIEMLAMKWKPDQILVEDKASGMSLLQELRVGTRLPIQAIKVDTDKVTRANACTPLTESGRVFLPAAAPWLTDFLEEISSFPNAPHDDCVDAFSQALNFVREAYSYTSLSQYYLNETAIDTYRATANYGMAAMRSGLPQQEVERLVAEADGDNEYTVAYEDEMRRLESGGRPEYTYGNRPLPGDQSSSITSLTAQVLADLQRGK
jgi:predicted phage terminase large subunit-like protein